MISNVYWLSDLVYENPLVTESNVAGFRLEGNGEITFPFGRMRLKNIRDPNKSGQANFVFWYPEEFPPDIAVSWDFWPIDEPGLCMLFFAARGVHGGDLFDE